MANTIHVDIVSAEGQIYSGEATVLFVPGSQGELGIHPRHAPLLTTLTAGEVRVQSEGHEEQSFFVGGGALEIQPHLVTVLADTAARAKDLDEAAALAAKRSGPKMRCATAAIKSTSPRRRRNWCACSRNCARSSVCARNASPLRSPPTESAMPLSDRDFGSRPGQADEFRSAEGAAAIGRGAAAESM